MGIANAFAAATLLSLCGCAPAAPLAGKSLATLETVSLIITEVAQATDYGATPADKVEVYCTTASGCASFKVCDTGSSCSAIQPSLGAHARTVVSRGSLITNTDQIWLANSSGAEIPDTRVGPFPCPASQSQSRPDWPIAAFAACAGSGLGESAGQCNAGDFPEPFVASVRFTTNQHGGPEPTCARPVCLELLAAINAAATSIDFAIYGVRAQDDIIGALAAAQARGVVVRGVVDTEDASCTSFGYSDTPTLMSALEPGSVSCDTGSGYSYIMHNKFFVFDRAKLWTGSTNISDTELGGEYNSDVAALLSSYRLAEIYEGEFEEMFAGTFHARKSENTQHVIGTSHFTDSTEVRSYFSPTDAAIAGAVIPLIDAATATLDIAMFYFTSQPIADAVLAAHQRGVVVRLVLDASGAGNVYSKHGLLCSSGVAVRVENWGPARVLTPSTTTATATSIAPTSTARLSLTRNCGAWRRARAGCAPTGKTASCGSRTRRSVHPRRYPS